MFNGIGVSGVLLLLIIALLLFGPNKLPELGRAFGRTLREFKAGARDIMGDDEDVKPARKEVQSVDVNQAPAPAASASQPAASAEQQRRLPE
ncbi:twin-arginine translocase TatA/TatE family subunit [Paenibacillus apiarius]|uniref:Sec-independent protein translocase protein TatA n=1 Tax=Paenibacillus apiarius TaxID=46240 RepID=A0ABT4DUT0_9BACL|nr:twin-arginine translocase TatA/TatE family subunit [Paenibacillus apiarius]MBN3523419.1 twin-arginine translocase TatA/TatE family subunit [Paenibacillus apiarius]MCY9514363.1 twin-arginine translocase TatA/TatE family subunit [Paenibacillus apiarius]MCY9521099.1 twin-arginine translocase TatA/TatE family subunit [Paenibacillus apiarius]MCY9551946.1 twin-arginine translocase TatA/TatE family subunit [Paenibacillus apiarius]MCY9557833.1 twin-arginine translocase TatA/TatE family subunit [Pae